MLVMFDKHKNHLTEDVSIRNIIVVDCKSSGINYIGDIVNRGYNPVVLELKWANEDVEEYQAILKRGYDSIDDEFDMIFERDTYEETLEAVKKYDPKLIVPGNEHGVILATRLANDLNLLCNPIENLDAMTLKDKMQERIAEAGLRHIRGKAVKSVDEAIDFYDREGLEEVVLKPTYSAGSAGVKMCNNRSEMIDALEEVFGTLNYYGENITEIVVQERIRGTEYYVNTASCDGVHMVSLIWKYNKVETLEGDIVYDTVETVNELGIGESEMVEYAYDVADAIGIRYGPVHGEYMIDENGPVLIEVNCRPSGASMPAKYLDRIAGHHETDLFLDSYLKPKRFHEKRKNRYRLLAHGALKLFIVPKDIIARSTPMNNISPRLKSFFGSTLVDIGDTEIFYPKTHDLDTSCGFVYLVHEDLDVLQKDIEFLRRVEMDAFSLVLSNEELEYEPIDDEKIARDIKKIVKSIEDYGTGLLITDQFIDDAEIIQTGIKDIDRLNGEFDYVIINLNKSMIGHTDDISVDIILSILSNIRVGGLVCVPKTTYEYFPSKRKGIEALIKTLNLRIEVPPHGLDVGIVASRESF